MASSDQLDPADRTPESVTMGMVASHKAYKSDECIPCGAVIKMGFFFDAFGRNRDQDDKATSRYSNICRLWEAHRDNLDGRRNGQPNQFWYRFYYSGMGTPLNDDAKNNELISAATKVGKALGNKTLSDAKSTGKKVIGLDKLEGIKSKPVKTIKDASKNALSEMSWRPIAAAYQDLEKQVKAAPGTIGKVLGMAADDRWVRRGKAAARGALYNVKKDPLMAGWKVVKGIGGAAAIGILVDSIPQVRDSKAAMIFGTGVDDRLHCAMEQFKTAYEDAKSQMHKIQRIEVSVFGADRGGVIARAFVNELVRTYRHKSDTDLRIGVGSVSEAPIEIKFLGLLDAVSSFIAENKLLDLIPYVPLKQNFGDRALDVPAAVKRCVHFAAAHELRFYQRLDSLEKTRGDQYLYPGTSEDVTGGAPPGALGMRGELQRVVLRDMLNEAVMAGSAVDRMEDLKKLKPITFEKFSLAALITEGKATYKIKELVEAYREVVPYQKGLDFQAHMLVFLRWLAVRYKSSEFRETVTAKTEGMKRDHQVLVKERERAEATYQQERERHPVDRLALGQAQARMMAAQEAERQALRSTVAELARPVTKVWNRLESEASEQMRQLSHQDGLQASARKIREWRDLDTLDPYYAGDMETSADTVESLLMPPEARALAQAWKDAADGKNPLPPKVMALFDMLVHDTMLTSWHDHVLSSTLYFQTRATDTFGKTDAKKETAQKKSDAQLQQRVEAVRRAREMWPARGANQFKKFDVTI